MKCSLVALAMDKAVEEYLAKIGCQGRKKVQASFDFRTGAKNGRGEGP